MMAGKVGTDIIGFVACPGTGIRQDGRPGDAPAPWTHPAPDPKVADIAAQFTALTGLAPDWRALPADDLAANLAAAGGRRAVIAYPGLAGHLADALAAGHDPVAALADWRQAMATLLALFRRRRGTTLLIETGTLATMPPDLADSLRAWTGTAGPAGLGHNSATTTTIPERETDPAGAFMAAAALLVARDLRDQTAELAAAGFAAYPPQPDRDAAAQMVDLLWQAQEQGVGQADLRRQVAGLQDRLEQDHLANRQLRNALAARDARVRQLEQDLRSLDATLQARTAEAGRLEEDLRMREQQQARFLAQADKDHQAEIASLHHRLDAERARFDSEMAAERALFYTSTSWRLTAPVRALRRRLDRLRIPGRSVR